MPETQTATVLRHLRRYGSLTPLEAANSYGILRLAARVDELRKQGHRITTETVRRGAKNFARYRLAGAGEPRGEVRHVPSL